VWWKNQHRPDAAELATLAAVGEPVGAVLRNTRLTTALDDRARRLRALVRP
jgi:hypothetical protein